MSVRYTEQTLNRGRPRGRLLRKERELNSTPGRAPSSCGTHHNHLTRGDLRQPAGRSLFV